MGGTKEAAKAKRRFGLTPHSVAAQRRSMMIVFLHLLSRAATINRAHRHKFIDTKKICVGVALSRRTAKTVPGETVVFRNDMGRLSFCL